MEGLNTHIGSFDSAFQQTPVVFESIGMNVLLNVSFGMIDDAVDVFRIRVKTVVSDPRVGEDFRAWSNVVSHLCMQSFEANIGQHSSLDLAVPL